jgi:hypothetical protein
MIAVVVVSYGDPMVTLECLESLYRHAGQAFHLVLVDNAANAESTALFRVFAARHDNLTQIRNSENQGFARACNQAIELILRDRRFDLVALLNNDAVIEENWLARMACRLDPANGVEMVAARMVEFERPDLVDSLGIVLYKTGIASNRKRSSEPLLGPCGGAALYTLDLLKSVRELSGYLFDPDFFCYAEDTDLALRARALGYACAMADDALVRHRGSHASGGGYNEFVAYYGLRNSIFALFKSLPADFFWRNAGWILLMQGAVVVKYLVKGRPMLLWRVYRDVARGLPRVLEQRKELKCCLGFRRLDWRAYVSPRFYDHTYLLKSLRNLYRRDIKSARL